MLKLYEKSKILELEGFLKNQSLQSKLVEFQRSSGWKRTKNERQEVAIKFQHIPVSFKCTV